MPVNLSIKNVVDASVLAAPGLLWYEMSEVARVKCRSHPVDAEAILEQLAEARRRGPLA